MSTSSKLDMSGLGRGGFTALELLVGTSLAVMLTLATAPLLISMQTRGTIEADRTITVLQGRVAVARLERDLRMASAGDCDFAVEGPILEASTKQVVFLGTTGGSSELCLIEWEVVGSTLMRRWTPCPVAKPISFAHALYVDNKSMLEGLAEDTRFEYLVNGAMKSGTLGNSELPGVRGLTLRGGGQDVGGQWSKAICCEALVGI
jgi:type II secretory pathway component PulJ